MKTRSADERVSRFMSLVLRHKPETIGLKMDRHGWVTVADLKRGLISHGFAITDATIEKIVADDKKTRYLISDDGRRIRANQGHSLPIDLGLTASPPPPYLFHGTASKSLNGIFAEGINKRNRQHVHLSSDTATAYAVGLRHGNPFILRVRAEAMQTDGYMFFLSHNAVWLTDHVPSRYIEAWTVEGNEDSV